MSLQLVVLWMKEALLPLYQLSCVTYKRSLLSSLTYLGTVVDSCTYMCGSISKEPKLLYKMASKYIKKKKAQHFQLLGKCKSKPHWDFISPQMSSVNQKSASAGKEVVGKTLTHSWWDVNYCSHCGNLNRGSRKPKNRTSIWPSPTSPGIHPKESKSAHSRDTFAPMLVGALLISYGLSLVSNR